MKHLLLSGLGVLLVISVASAQQSSAPRFAQAAADDQALPKGFKSTPVLK